MVLQTDSTTGTTTNSGPLCLGRRCGQSQYWSGTIDSLVIYNHTLTAEQVSLLYSNRTDTIASNETTTGENWSVDVTPNNGTEDGATVTSNQITITNITDTCTYPGSGDWTVTVSDNCVITNLQDAGTNCFVLTGDTGTFTIANGGEVRAGCYHFTPDDFDGDVSFVVEPGGKRTLTT